MIRRRKVEIMWFDNEGPRLESTKPQKILVTSSEEHIFSVGFHAESLGTVSSLYLKGSSLGFSRSKGISCGNDGVLHVFGDVGATPRLTQHGNEKKVLQHPDFTVAEHLVVKSLRERAAVVTEDSWLLNFTPTHHHHGCLPTAALGLAEFFTAVDTESGEPGFSLPDLAMLPLRAAKVTEAVEVDFGNLVPADVVSFSVQTVAN